MSFILRVKGFVAQCSRVGFSSVEARRRYGVGATMLALWR